MGLYILIKGWFPELGDSGVLWVPGTQWDNGCLSLFDPDNSLGDSVLRPILQRKDLGT